MAEPIGLGRFSQNSRTLKTSRCRTSNAIWIGSKTLPPEADKLIQGYRIAPSDGVLEHVAHGFPAALWAPVMPNVVLPADWPYEEGDAVTWRRYAFERAHATLLEPHRVSSLEGKC